MKVGGVYIERHGQRDGPGECLGAKDIEPFQHFHRRTGHLITFRRGTECEQSVSTLAQERLFPGFVTKRLPQSPGLPRLTPNIPQEELLRKCYTEALCGALSFFLLAGGALSLSLCSAELSLLRRRLVPGILGERRGSAAACRADRRGAWNFSRQKVGELPKTSGGFNRDNKR